MNNRNRESLWIALGLLGLMSATLFFGIREYPSSFDDAYITYRYARNIALGHGFVYNLEEPVLGTTTPLYTLLLAGLSLIWHDIPVLSHYVSGLAWTLCVPVVYGIGRAEDREAVGFLSAAFIAINALFLKALGMETSLYVLLALLAFYFHLKDLSTWAAVCAGLTFLVRWDGILVVGAFLFSEMLKRRKTFLRASVICMGIIIPWLAYSYMTFGSIFPASFFAKVGQGWNQNFGGAEIGSFARGFLLLANSAFNENVLFIAVPLFAVFGLFSTLRNRVPWWPLLVWTATYVGGYIALGVPRFNWYYPPLVPALGLLTAEGIEVVSRSISQRLDLSGRRAVITALLSVLCLVPNADWLVNSQRTEMGVQSATYVEVGRWLREHTPSDSSVAMIEIGIIGYYSDRTIVDTMGLVSPDMLGHLEGWLQTLQFAINHYWPDYVVALQRTAWDGIVNEPWFKEAYRFETQIENAGDPRAPATVYRRREQFPLSEFALSSSREVKFDKMLELSEFQVVEDQVEPGDNLHVQLEWEAQSDISTDYLWQFNLLNASDGRQRTLASNLQPMRGGNPTHQWLEGDYVVDVHTLTIPNDVSAGNYLLKLLVLGEEGPVAIHGPADTPANPIAVGPIQIGTRLTAMRQPNYPVAATFAEDIGLEGYDLEITHNNSLSMTLYWRTAKNVSTNYTAFVHFLSPEGELVAQHDSPPLLPTSLWSPGIQVADTHNLALPADLPAKVYQIRVGLYHWPELERLSVLDSGCLDATDDSLLVGHLISGNAQPLRQSTCPSAHWIEIGE